MRTIRFIEFAVFWAFLLCDSIMVKGNGQSSITIYRIITFLNFSHQTELQFLFNVY
jgi:hypothetical protein